VEVKYAYPSFVKAWSLRLCLIIFMPTVVFTLYQWSLKDSWLSTLLSVIMFLFIWACILCPTSLTFRLAFHGTPYALYTHTKHLASCGPLFAQYRTSRYYFFICLIAGSFLKAIFIASLKEHGEAQVILILLVELGICLAHIILRPYKSQGGDILATFIAVVRLVATGLMIAFVESLALAAIPRVVIGIVIAVLFSIAALIMLLNNLIHGVKGLWPPSSRRSHSHQESTNESILEKGGPLAPGLSPTPELSARLSSQVHRPSSATPAIQPSEYSQHDSISMTDGSISPRPLSFSREPRPSSSPSVVDMWTTPGHSRPSTLEDRPPNHT